MRLATLSFLLSMLPSGYAMAQSASDPAICTPIWQDWINIVGTGTLGEVDSFSRDAAPIISSCPDLGREVKIVRSRAKLQSDMITQYERQISNRDSEISRKESEILKNAQSLQQANEQIRELNQLLIRSRSRNSELESALALPENDAQNQLVRALDNIAELNETLGESAQSLAAEKQLTRNLSNDVSRLERDLRGRGSEIASLNQSIRSKDDQISNLQAQISEITSN